MHDDIIFIRMKMMSSCAVACMDYCTVLRVHDDIIFNVEVE